MKYPHTFLVALTAMSISAFSLAGHHEKGEVMEAAHAAMEKVDVGQDVMEEICLLYTSPSPRD